MAGLTMLKDVQKILSFTIIVILFFGCTDNGGLRDNNDTRQSAMPSVQQTDSEQEIIVRFKPDTPDSLKIALQQEAGLELVKKIPQLNMHIFKVAAGTSTDQAVAFCKKQSCVQYVEMGQKYETQKEQPK